MAIDTKSLTQIITEFRKLSAKDSITPESLGYILQRIADLLATGGSNAYTIQKNGVKKMIYQTAWKENGEVAGLVEISMIIPEEMPHYVR